MEVGQNANEIIIGDGSVNNFYDYFSLHFSLYPKFLQQAVVTQKTNVMKKNTQHSLFPTQLHCSLPLIWQKCQ